MSTLARWLAVVDRFVVVVLFACAAAGTTMWSGIAAAQSAAAPDPGWANVLAAAKREGRVFIYSSVPTPITSRQKADFEKAHPDIVFEFARFNSGQLLTKVDQERATGADGGDVLIGTDIGWAEARIKDGSVKVNAGPDARAWPAPYLIGGVVPVLAMEPITITYNTSKVKSPPTGYMDLLKPEYRGKVGVLDISAATTVVAFYDWIAKNYGADYLGRLAANQPIVYASAPNAAQSVAAGELEIASFINTASGGPLVEQGAPIRMVVPSPAFGFRYVGATLGWAKRPNAAQVFMNYAMSPRGQTAWSGKGDSASPLPNIPGSLDAKTISPYDPSPYTAEVVKAQIARWNAMFKGR
jgi:iron(III) transport system substrate-binding protein